MTTALKEWAFSDIGDAVLVVGSNDVSRYRVHTRVLATASPVFKIMFGSDWSEGQGLCEKTPKEIRLPNDIPRAMELISGCLHFQLADPPSPQELVQVAVHSQKYDLDDALSPSVRAWLVAIEPETDGDRLCCHLAAHHFDIQSTKFPWTFELVGNYSGSYEVLFGKEKIEGLLDDDGMAYNLEEVRNRLRLKLLDFVHESPCEPFCVGRKDTKMTAKLRQIRQNFKPSTLLSVGAIQQMVQLKNIFSDQTIEQWDFDSGVPSATSCVCGYKLFRKLDDLKAGIENGLAWW